MSLNGRAARRALAPDRRRQRVAHCGGIRAREEPQVNRQTGRDPHSILGKDMRLNVAGSRDRRVTWLKKP